MSEAAVDRLLAVLIVALLATGVLTWRAGSEDTYWLYLLHGILAGVLLAASVLKLRRSLPRALAKRRWRQLLVSAPLALATFLSLAIGFAWVAGGQFVQLGPWTLLGWHATVAWVIVGLVAVHLLMSGRWRVLKPRLRRGAQRPAAAAERPPQAAERPAQAAAGHPAPVQASAGQPARRRTLSRRTLVAGGLLAFAGLVTWGIAEVLDRLSAAPRRFTGSRWLPKGGVPPPTTFFGEGTPAIDQAAWRLRVDGAVDRPLELSLDELRALGLHDWPAVLDCTGGWAMETSWQGVPLSTVLDAAGARPSASTINVRSVTGWGASMSVDEARGTLLATGVAGAELPAPNGAPCRLVVPNRRGLDWVKWVAEIAVS
jgi:hypothetical protein